MMFGLFILGIGTLPMACNDVNTPLLIVMIYGAIGVWDHVRATVHHEHGFAILVVGEIECRRRHRELRTPNGWISWHNHLGVFVDQRTFYNEGLAMTQDASNASSRELLDGVVRR